MNYEKRIIHFKTLCKMLFPLQSHWGIFAFFVYMFDCHASHTELNYYLKFKSIRNTLLNVIPLSLSLEFGGYRLHIPQLRYINTPAVYATYFLFKRFKGTQKLRSCLWCKIHYKDYLFQSANWSNWKAQMWSTITFYILY